MAKQLAYGSLEDMVREAIARSDDTHASLRQAFFIDAGSDDVLTWPDIEKLRSSPDFPVEI